MNTLNASIDPEEVQRFSERAADWWDTKGAFAPLHRFNAARLAFFRERLLAHFHADPRSVRPLDGKRVLDIGCGGGLVAEPFARWGAAVTGVDPAAESIAVAQAHAAENGLDIRYRAGTAEEFAAEGTRFDIVIASEVVEHVIDVPGFVKTVADLVLPGGLVLFSTLNRTPQAYALAIIGAERVLRWLPPGTHRFDRFVRPSELSTDCRAAGLRPAGESGIVYRPLSREWRLSPDMAVNYGFAAVKPV